MADDYGRGQRDGLRLALGILAAEESKWAALIGESRSWRTNQVREVRLKTLQVAQKRVQTVLNRMTPRDDRPTPNWSTRSRKRGFSVAVGYGRLRYRCPRQVSDAATPHRLRCVARWTGAMPGDVATPLYPATVPPRYGPQPNFVSDILGLIVCNASNGGIRAND